MFRSRIVWTAVAALLAAQLSPLAGAAQQNAGTVAGTPTDGATACERFADRVGRLAALHPNRTDAFLAALQAEFVGGAADPIALRDALEAGRWNPAFFYAGHGGFVEQLDDNRAKYARGGNHQPGHFVAMLAVAAQHGPQVAAYASQAAGDYAPDQQDDLRLSRTAIALGLGLANATLGPADVAGEARRFCRNRADSVLQHTGR